MSADFDYASLDSDLEDVWDGLEACVTCGSATAEAGRVCGPCLALAFVPAPPADDAVFVYGTLRPGCGNDRLWRSTPDVEVLPATADGLRLVGEGRAFPYALEAPGAVSVGDLLIFPAADRARLLQAFDWLEGAPSHYQRLTVAVTVAGVVRSAWVYVASTAGYGSDRIAQMPPVPGNDWRNV